MLKQTSLLFVLITIIWQINRMSETTALGIPVIDLSGLEDPNKANEWMETTKSIAEACRDYGFFYVRNHGVSEDVQNNMMAVLRKFFALPMEEKDKINSQSTGGMVGYFKFQSETSGFLVDEGPDWREGIYAFGDELPDGHPNKDKFPLVTQKNLFPKQPHHFKEVVASYHDELKVLGFKIMSALAQGMGLKKDFFDQEFFPNSSTTIGMYHYLPSTNQPNEISCGQHTDYGTLTILMQDDVGGLEIQSDDNTWIPAPPIPGTFVINLGDMLEVWTNGAYKATVHQVRKSKSGRDRISVAYFFDPKLESVVKPLEIINPLIPFPKRKINSNIKLPVIFGEFLEEKYKGTFPDHEYV